jgi:hypothetical protein
MEGFRTGHHVHIARCSISRAIGAIYRGIGCGSQPLDLDCQPISRYNEESNMGGMVASATSGRVRPSALKVIDPRVFDPQGSIDKPVDSPMRQ